MTRMPSRRRQSGFSLLEVLIAVLVLAIGLLGLAGLQSLSLKYNHSAYLRSQAVQLAYDMADRVRANSAAFSLLPGGAEEFPDAYDEGGFDGDFSGLPAEQACISTVAGCNPAQVADQDFRRWNHMVRDTLPDGVGVVSRFGVTMIEISVRWTEQVDVDGDGVADTQEFLLRFAP